MTDQELLQDFEKLYDRFFDKIYGFVYRRVDDKETVHDIVSETFLKIYKGLSKFELTEKGTLSSWVFTIAQNEVFQYYRKMKGKRAVPLEEDIDLAGNEDVLSEVNSKQISEITKKLLQELEEEDLSILLMKYFDELRNTEIAALLKINANNVGVKLHRALQKFKTILEHHHINL